MARTIVTPIQMRFSDLDPFHHVNNVAQQMYFDVGKSDYYERVAGEELLADRLRIVTVSTQTSYLGQVRIGDRLTVETACERIGTKSLTLFQRLMADGQVRSESRSVMVAFDFAAQQSVAVPDRWRQRMLEE